MTMIKHCPDLQGSQIIPEPDVLAAKRASALIELFGPDSDRMIMEANDEDLGRLKAVFNHGKSSGVDFPYPPVPEKSTVRGSDAIEAVNTALHAKVSAVRDTAINKMASLPEEERNLALVNHMGLIAGGPGNDAVIKYAERASDYVRLYEYSKAKIALGELSMLAVDRTILVDETDSLLV